MNDTPDGSAPLTGQPAAGAPQAGKERKKGKGFLWALVAIIVAFGGGAGWQYYERSLVEAELAETQQELTVERLRVGLSYAALAAQAGDFEAARQGMSQVFTRLTDLRESLPEPVTRVADSFLTRRDDIITGLSRSNSEYAGVLYDMLERFQAAAGLGETPVAAPPPEAAEPTTEPATEPTTEPTTAVEDTVIM